MKIVEIAFLISCLAMLIVNTKKKDEIGRKLNKVLAFSILAIIVLEIILRFV